MFRQPQRVASPLSVTSSLSDLRTRIEGGGLPVSLKSKLLGRTEYPLDLSSDKPPLAAHMRMNPDAVSDQDEMQQCSAHACARHCPTRGRNTRYYSLIL